MLIESASRGMASTVQMLLEQEGADIDMVEGGAPEGKGRAALHWAAANGHLETVQIILDSAADIDVQDIEGSTAVHLAASSRKVFGGFPAVVDLLLTEGCDCMIEDNASKTAWRRAVEMDHKDCAKVLRRAAGMGHPGAKVRVKKEKTAVVAAAAEKTENVDFDALEAGMDSGDEGKVAGAAADTEGS